MTTTSAGTPEAVFALLADGAGWRNWAGPFGRNSRWEREGDPPPGGVGAIRRLGSRPLLAREEIVESIPPRRLAYRILSGVPMRDYLGIVDLEPTDGGGTRIVWQGSFVPKIPGTGALTLVASRYAVKELAKRLAAAGDRAWPPRP